MDYKEKYNEWLNDGYFDEQTKNELKDISNDEKEIEDRFYRELEFGTGGLRGVIGAGTNRMNKYTVSKATQGLANYILKSADNGKEMGVCIAYDSRNQSPEFADVAASVLNGNGIKAYVFDELRPTPELSFAVRHLGCVAGIVITASHNPPEYNGYKAYWSDGGQVPYPRDEEIIQEVNLVENFTDVKIMSKEEALAQKFYIVIGAEVDDVYVNNVKAQMINGQAIKEASDSLKIVYTPIHGTGNKPIRRVLSEVGFKNVYVVKEQELPDANFSTVGYPNPEDPKVFVLAKQLAQEVGADLIIGTDPDCDRVGIVVKNQSGEFEILTGNMTGVLLTEYILSQKKAKSELPKDGVLIKTIVTTEMVRPIAEEYGVQLIDVLTGFKYIGEKIKQFEESGSNTYIFGFEESYGCLAGTYARDKDAVVAAMLVSELAAHLKTKGITLNDHLQQLYAKYGYYKEEVKSITLKGIEGVEKIKHIMTTIRSNPPTSFAGISVSKLSDFKTQTTKDFSTGETQEITLPVSDVLRFELSDKSWACIRPSGTEPKIKIYFGVCADSAQASNDLFASLSASVMQMIDAI